MSEPELQTVTFRIANDHDDPIQFVLEPWGEEYEIAPGWAIDVVMRGPVGDLPDIRMRMGCVIVVGWSGSVAWLFQNGKEMGERLAERLPVPSLPEGMRVSGFLNLLLGPAGERPAGTEAEDDPGTGSAPT